MLKMLLWRPPRFTDSSQAILEGTAGKRLYINIGFSCKAKNNILQKLEFVPLRLNTIAQDQQPGSLVTSIVPAESIEVPIGM